MKDNFCFLCASDEGVFLDVYSDPNFFEKIETCLSSKLDKDPLTNKICYKCAFEVDQCCNFVKKCKFNKASDRKNKNCCCLCAEIGKKGKIFDLFKEKHSINNPLEKIQNIFDNDFGKQSNFLICLTCRYYLDVLYDLKTVYKTVSLKLRDATVHGLSVADIPKVKTFVINRKTTSTQQAKFELQALSDSDSDSSVMARNRRNKNQNTKSRSKVSKTRVCDKCKTSVENGVDMFRFHRTGLTVCKGCWIKEDPSKIGKRKRADTKDTKRCTVFLKDVLNNDLSSDEIPYKIEKDEDGNTTYIVTVNSSENEDQPRKKSKVRESKNPPGKSRVTNSHSSDSDILIEEVEATVPLRVRRSSSKETNNHIQQAKEKSPKTQSSDSSSEGGRIKRKIQNSEPLGEPGKVATSKRTRSSSVSSSSSTICNKFKSPTRKSGKTSQKLNLKIEEQENESSYTCNTCGMDFENKLTGITHELTHSKNLEVKLHRIKADKLPIVSENEPEEQSQDVSSTSDTKDINNGQVIDANTTPQSLSTNENELLDIAEEKEIAKEVIKVENDEKSLEGSGNSENSQNVVNDEKKKIKTIKEQNITDKSADQLLQLADDVDEDKEKCKSDTTICSSSIELVSEEENKENKEIKRQDENDADAPNNIVESIEVVTGNVSLENKSLEDMLHREELQVIDEVNNSEKEIDDDDKIMGNIELHEIHDIKDKCLNKDAEVESEVDIKIMDTGSSECSIDESPMESQKTSEKEIVTIEISKEKEADRTDEQMNEIKDKLSQEELLENNDSISEITVSQILEEVFIQATHEVEKRLNAEEAVKNDIENIECTSNEVNSNADMPSLDPICDEMET